MKSSTISQIDKSMVAHTRLLKKLDAEKKQFFYWKMEMSWIFHDSALDGIVLAGADLTDAFNVQIVSDISLQPLYNEVRNHKVAIEFIKTIAAKRNFMINQELLRKLQNIFTSEGAASTAQIKYRREIPIHRMYFHEILSSKNMKNTMKGFFEWANSGETKKMHVIARAAVIHYRFMRIFPFASHTGKIGRLIMNILLLRGGYIPAVVHSSDRQAYYETLRESADAFQELLERSLNNTVKSNVRIIDDLLPGRRRVLNV
ncbi:MAG: Fic family protein [Pseudomonadota bacterium]